MPYERTAALLSKIEFEYFKSHEISDGCTPKEFLEAKLYVEKNSQMPYYEAPIDTVTFKPKGLMLLMTNACQLNCRYCHSFGGESTSNGGIATDSAMFMIDTYGIPAVFFHGWGEPTLCMSTVKEIVERSRVKVNQFYMTTNGMFGKRREEYVDFLAENDFFIWVSYDGISEINDRQRPMKNGKPSSAEIIETITELIKRYGEEKAKNRLTVRVTVTKLGERRIPEMVRHLNSLGVRNATFQPLVISGRAARSTTEETEPVDLYGFSDSLLDAYFLGKKLGFGVFSTMLPLRGPRCTFCGYASMRDVVLTPDLKLSGCSEYVSDHTPFIFGAIEKQSRGFKVMIDEKKFLELKQRNSNLFNRCMNCPVKCGGGCTKVSWESNNSLSVPGESTDRCDARVYLLYNMIEREMSMRV